ncbi:MAG: septum formation initiator family protein [Bacteroidales bacterium]|nr:septum formation initiator family protein [Bacteroidales bacterium]
MKNKIISRKAINLILAGTVVFIVWVAFFDEYNFLEQRRNRRKLEQLLEQQARLKRKIAFDRQKIYELRTNPENLEKFAREQFRLKKENEDVFIVVEE